jgi:hypothetical protein
MRAVIVGLAAAAACGSHGAAREPDAHTGTQTDATSLDARVRDATTPDALASTSGISPLLFSIDWPSTDAAAPPANSPWPTLVGTAFGSLRTWGSRADWAGIEPTHCSPTDLTTCWNWTDLAAFLHDNNELHFVPADYPDWSNGSAGSGTPPNDVSSTTVCTAIPAGFRSAAGLLAGDCQFQELAFAVAMYACGASCNAANGPWQGRLAIRSFSPGNEVNGKQYFDPPCKSGQAAPCATLARLSEDLYRIIKYVDPTALVGTASFTQLTGDADLGYYLEQSPSPGVSADMLIAHIYGTGDSAGDTTAFAAGMPETNWATRLAGYRALLDDTHHMADKPMWIDEGGWGENFQTNAASTDTCANTDCGCTTAPKTPCMNADSTDNQTIVATSATLTNAPAPGYLVRGYLQMIAAGVARFYWYGVNAGEWGSLGDFAGTTLTPTAADAAWQAMVRWLVGATVGTLTPPTTGTQWTYSIVGKAGMQGCRDVAADASYHALIAWDTAGASTFACGTFSTYCTLADPAGTSHTCSGSAPIGPNPILLEP